MDDVCWSPGPRRGSARPVPIGCTSGDGRWSGPAGGAPPRADWAPLVMDVDDDASVRGPAVEAVVGASTVGSTRVVACAGWGLAGAVEETPIGRRPGPVRDQLLGRRAGGAGGPARHAAPGQGRIVLMSSIGGVVGIPFQAFYSASKFALEGYGEALAYEVAPFGIEVTLVEPGNVRPASPRPGATSPAGGGPVGLRRRRGQGGGQDGRGRGRRRAPDKVADVVQRVLEATAPPAGLGGQVGRTGRDRRQAAAALPPLRTGGQG